MMMMMMMMMMMIMMIVIQVVHLCLCGAYSWTAAKRVLGSGGDGCCSGRWLLLQKLILPDMDQTLEGQPMVEKS